MSNHTQIDRFKKLTETETKARFLKIFAAAHHGDQGFEARYGKEMWRWMEVYSRVQSHDLAEILDAVSMAFGQCVAKKNKQLRALEQRIVAQKKEIAKLLGDRITAAAPAAGTLPCDYCGQNIAAMTTASNAIAMGCSKSPTGQHGFTFKIQTAPAARLAEGAAR